ncbi:MAG TPA: MarR family transcriptional regulator [Dehalococcoidia bacterium]|nr:MarR family transcriptional regulator [Dehalococcoidia bacterium]
MDEPAAADEAALREDAFHLFGRVLTRSDPGRLEAWAGLGLTMTQLRVLFLLRAEEGLSAGALADGLAVTPSTLTRIMDRLVRNGLVQRQIDDDDRRLVRHNLTRSGLRTVEEMERTGRARMNLVFARLSPQQLERLVLALRDLAAAAEAVQAEDAQKVEV